MMPDEVRELLQMLDSLALVLVWQCRRDLRAIARRLGIVERKVKKPSDAAEPASSPAGA